MLDFKEVVYRDASPTKLSGFKGHVQIAVQEYTMRGLAQSSNAYYFQFSTDEITQDLNYKPRKYVNHKRYQVSDTANTYAENGVLKGNVVIDNHNPGANEFKLHFYFHVSGSHGLSGTIDYKCIRIIR